MDRNLRDGPDSDGDIIRRYQEFFWGLPSNSSWDSAIDVPRIDENTDANNGACYRNPQAFGSIQYQRMKDYHGPLYQLQTGSLHQGYGVPTQYNGYFGFGTGAIILPVTDEGLYYPPRNCTSGIFYNGTWLPGTCEADIICDVPVALDIQTESSPCPEGFVCPEETEESDTTGSPCPAGYACDVGTTPDLSLFAPRGMYSNLCPAGFSC